MNKPHQPIAEENWQFAISLEKLMSKKVVKTRIEGKQLAFFATDSGIHACDNRCPHEGYPLSEGSVSENCTLTCNWHNWKFNLETGENLFGGDKLRTYPVEVREDEVWVDMKEPPYQQQYDSVVSNLRYAFDHESYDQIARECARLQLLGADPMDVLRFAIDWSWQKLEFGWTHAYAGMADWLELYDEYSGDAELQLTCLLESVSHASFDVLREKDYPYTKAIQSFDEPGFLHAIETEDEEVAIAMIAGGLKDGLQFKDFEGALTQAALAHYNDFGHSLIYVTKIGVLINRLGPQVEKPLLFSLVRSFIYSAREDQIPEFRKYASALKNWGEGEGIQPSAKHWYRQSINRSLDAAVACSDAASEVIYQELLLANAISMLGFNIKQQSKVATTVSGNVGWLDFTHGLTFANAVRKQCSRFPEMWPQGLLQMACFVGRNAAFTTEDYSLDQWAVDDIGDAIANMIEGIFAHGVGEHIVSVHLLKTTLAVREEASLLEPKGASVLIASLNRFLHSPLKRRIPRRVAHQSLRFVGSNEAEGT